MRRVVISFKCSPDDPNVVCSHRFVMESEGSMWWDEKGWHHKELLRVQSPPKDTEAGWKRKYYELQDHTGEPLTLERCCACQIPLPDLTVKAPEAPRNTQADGAQGGEGWE